MASVWSYRLRCSSNHTWIYALVTGDRKREKVAGTSARGNGREFNSLSRLTDWRCYDCHRTLAVTVSVIHLRNP